MKNEILKLIEESPGQKFKLSEIVEILGSTASVCSLKLKSLIKNGYIKQQTIAHGCKVYFIDSDATKSELTKARVPPTFKPMKGYGASLSSRLDDDRKEFHPIAFVK